MIILCVHHYDMYVRIQNALALLTTDEMQISKLIPKRVMQLRVNRYYGKNNIKK